MVKKFGNLGESNVISAKLGMSSFSRWNYVISGEGEFEECVNGRKFPYKNGSIFKSMTRRLTMGEIISFGRRHRL